MKIRVLLSIVMLGLFLICAGSAQAYVINGRLADWGVNPSTGDWTPKKGYYTVEDSTAAELAANGGYVAPGWGGQRFDAEALYLDWDDTNLYLALVTGFPKTGVNIGNSYYSAGDIAIDFGVNGTYDYGIEIGGHYPGNYDGLWGGAGNVYGGSDFNPLEWVNSTTILHLESNPLYMERGQRDKWAGEADKFRYNSVYYGEDHWVVELSIPKTVFDSDWNDYMRVHWTQSCGNDNINLTTPVPEPMSLSLLGLGLLGMIGAGIRKRK